MIGAKYVYTKQDKLTQTEIQFVAGSGHFKLFLQAIITDCNVQLAQLDTKSAEKLAADYRRITTTREVYEDLLDLLSKLTAEKGEKQ